MHANILLIDIETAPHRVFAWGLWGQDIHLNQIEEPGYTLCWSAKWLGDRGVMFSSIGADGKEEMLSRIYDLLDEADIVVHYNGTKFDIPMLNQEFLTMGWAPPSPYKQVDLLKTARSRFRLASNKLDYVADALGVGAKIKTKGMALWRACMDDDASAWKAMERYNKRDVNLLEKVYKKMLPWIANHPNLALYTDSERPICTNCGSKHVQSRGIEHTKTLSYRRFQCVSCGNWMRGKTNILPKEKRQSVLVNVK